MHHLLILTDQKEVSRFPHNGKAELGMPLETHALIPKSESSFLFQIFNKLSQQERREFLISSHKSHKHTIRYIGGIVQNLSAN